LFLPENLDGDFIKLNGFRSYETMIFILEIFSPDLVASCYTPLFFRVPLRLAPIAIPAWNAWKFLSILL
jgi:hypothetical protein